MLLAPLTVSFHLESTEAFYQPSFILFYNCYHEEHICFSTPGRILSHFVPKLNFIFAEGIFSFGWIDNFFRKVSIQIFLPILDFLFFRIRFKLTNIWKFSILAKLRPHIVPILFVGALTLDWMALSRLTFGWTTLTYYTWFEWEALELTGAKVKQVKAEYSFSNYLVCSPPYKR